MSKLNVVLGGHAKNQFRNNPQLPGEPEQQANLKPPPSPADLSYSYAELSGLLDKYEEERRLKLDEELKALHGRPTKLPEQSVREYLHENRDWLKESSPKIFANIGEVNKREHAEMQEKGTFKSISFDKANPTPLEIKDKSGKVLHTLEYKDDGGLVIAQVPKNIPRGPMHLSLALQDANGENIDADKAVFFNISYGPDGKIKSMNYPEPLEFDGDKCKFKVEGEYYYLKVDKATLEGLNKEMKQNKARAADVGVGVDIEEAAPFVIPDVASPAPKAPEPLDLGIKQPSRVNPLVNPGMLETAKKGLKPPKKPDPIPSPAAGLKPHTPIPPAAPPPPANNPKKPAPVVPPPVKPNVSPAIPKAQPMNLGGKGGANPPSPPPVNLQAARAGLKPTGNLVKGEFVKTPEAHPEAPSGQPAGGVAEKAVMPTPPVPPVAKVVPKTPIDPAHSTPSHFSKNPDGTWGKVETGKPAPKPFGDPNHNQFTAPGGKPPVVASESGEHKPLKPKFAEIKPSPAPGLGGAKPKPVGDPNHNQFSMPPGGFNNEKPQWQKELAAKNAAKSAERLRVTTPVTSHNPVSPGAGGRDPNNSGKLKEGRI